MIKTIIAFVCLVLIVSTFSCGSNKNAVGESQVRVQTKKDSSYVEGQSIKIKESSLKAQSISISKPDTTTTKSRKRN